MMNGNEMAQTQVGSDKVLSFYQQKLASMTHELALTTAYVQQLQERERDLLGKIEVMAEEIEQLRQPDLLEEAATEAKNILRAG